MKLPHWQEWWDECRELGNMNVTAENQRDVAYLGLGIMGAAMAANLARAGHRVRLWNRTGGRPGLAMAQDAGGVVCGSIAEAVSGVEVVLLCLGDQRDVEEVCLGNGGVAEAVQPGTLVVDMATTGPRCAKAVGECLGRQGIRFLDAPVSGGDVGARAGTLTIMVGGASEDFLACTPLFECMGKVVVHCGPVGSGQAVKLCNQVLCALNMVGVCEALSLAQAMNIDPTLVVEVCATGAAGSWALSNLAPKILAHDLEPAFMIKHMLKDLALVGGVIDQQGLCLPGVKLADNQFKSARDLAGSGAQGTQAMIRTYQGT
jgi:3-hydroxyisobutyrate dehydrogenase